jgi:hypothetical protein
VAADEQSLREALAFIGGRLVTRADGPITTVAISPDNRWLANKRMKRFSKKCRRWSQITSDAALGSLLLTQASKIQSNPFG